MSGEDIEKLALEWVAAERACDDIHAQWQAAQNEVARLGHILRDAEGRTEAAWVALEQVRKDTR